jgi:hypothetical protein
MPDAVKVGVELGGVSVTEVGEIGFPTTLINPFNGHLSPAVPQ